MTGGIHNLCAALEVLSVERVSQDMNHREFDVAVIIRTAAFGGTERHTISLIRYLMESGVRVLLIESGEKIVSTALKGESENLSFIHTELPMAETPKGVLREWDEILSRFHSTCAVLVKPWFYAASVPFLNLLRKHFARLVQIEHTTVAPRTKWHLGIHVNNGIHPGLWWYKEQFKTWRIARASPEIITVSDFNKRCLVENAFVDKRRIAVCKNGVDTKKWRYDRTSGVTFRRELNIPESDVVFSCVGRLAPEKGYELSIDAFNQLASAGRRKNIHLCIVGEGPERNKLEERAKANWEYIHFTGFRNDVNAVYSATDVLLAPSLHETYWSGESFGYSLVESMACQCNVIASACGAIPEIIGDSGCDCLIYGRSVSAWADAMDKFARTRSDVRKLMGAKRREWVVMNFEESARMTDLVKAILH